MKKIFPILGIFLCLCSCHTDDSRLFTYKVKNESGKDITVKAYSRTNLSRKPVITVIDDGEQIVKHYESDPPSNPNAYSFTGFFRGDSITVDYGNDRRQIFVEEHCGGSEKNPLNFCLYNNTEETFIFSKEHYDDALPFDEENV